MNNAIDNLDWLTQVQKRLIMGVMIGTGINTSRVLDLYENNFTPDDAVEELLRPVIYSQLMRARAADVLLRATIDYFNARNCPIPPPQEYLDELEEKVGQAVIEAMKAGVAIQTEQERTL